MKRNSITALFIAFLVMLGVALFDGNVIAKQQKLIREMSKNPACMVDPQPTVKPEPTTFHVWRHGA